LLGVEPPVEDGKSGAYQVDLRADPPKVTVGWYHSHAVSSGSNCTARKDTAMVLADARARAGRRGADGQAGSGDWDVRGVGEPGAVAGYRKASAPRCGVRKTRLDPGTTGL
jgi:hypothetical protein